MNSIKLAEENVRASLLKKLLNLSALNCCKCHWSRKNYFSHCLTGWNSFQRLQILLDVQAEESEFQTSVPCANLIKMKTHFQFILMNWNITSSKMARKNILEG